MALTDDERSALARLRLKLRDHAYLSFNTESVCASVLLEARRIASRGRTITPDYDAIGDMMISVLEDLHDERERALSKQRA